MMQLARRFAREETGATAIEYGMIAALISVAIITALGLIGGHLQTAFETIEQGLAGTGS